MEPIPARRRARLVAAALGLIALVVFGGVPGTTRLHAAINNAGHAPIFGAIAWIVLQVLVARSPDANQRAWPYVSAFALALVAGIGVEWLQSLAGRSPSAFDIGMDAAGAAVALAICAAFAKGRARPHIAAGCVAVVVVGVAAVIGPLAEAALAYSRRAATFPVVLLPERRLDLYFVSGTGATITPSRLPSDRSTASGEPALRVDFGPGQYPGVRHDEPAPDWRGFESLHVDVINPGLSPLELVLRIHDADHDQRYADRLNYAFALPPTSRQVISVPIAELERAPAGRLLDLSRIAGLVLFSVTEQSPAGAHFYVARIWLQ